MTGQQQHLPEHCRCSSTLLHCSPLLLGQWLRQMRAPSLLRQSLRVSEGNLKHKNRCLLSRRNVDMSKRTFCANCISGEQRIAFWLLQRGLLGRVAHRDADKPIEGELEILWGARQLLNPSTSSQRMTGRELRFVPQPCGCMTAHT